MTNLIEKKIEALKKHLIRNDKFSADELEDLTYQESYEEFEIGDHSYKVLTDEEADEQTKEYIKESLWAFNPNFLSCYVPEGVSEKVITILQQECEDCNDALLGMVNAVGRFDDLVQDAIASDGRGHFLSHYDGCEYDEVVGNEWFYIYRTN